MARHLNQGSAATEEQQDNTDNKDAELHGSSTADCESCEGEMLLLLVGSHDMLFGINKAHGKAFDALPFFELATDDGLTPAFFDSISTLLHLLSFLLNEGEFMLSPL